MFTDRDNDKLSRVVKENRRRTYKDTDGIVNKGNNHRFCTRTIKRKIKSLDTKGGLSTKRLGVNGVRRGETGLLIMTGVNGCLVMKVYIWRKDDEKYNAQLV